MHLKLSIIVPIYNVEKYIRPCIESIFNQGLNETDFEVILINDGTPDRSMEMILDFIDAHRNINVINQESQGPSVARNNGMEKATGEYILFVDSDDLLVNNTLPMLLDLALDSKADMVTANFRELKNSTSDKPHNIRQPEFEAKVRTGQEAFLKDLNPYDCHIWRILFRRDFLESNHIHFIPGICFEDIPFTYECYFKAQKAIITNRILYLYRVGIVSITSTFEKKKGLDFASAIGYSWNLKKHTNKKSVIYKKLRDCIFANFSQIIFFISHDIKKQSDRMEILNQIKMIAPDMNFHHGYKQTFVNFMYHNMPSTYIHLRVFYDKTIAQGYWYVRDFVRIIRSKIDPHYKPYIHEHI